MIDLAAREPRHARTYDAGSDAFLAAVNVAGWHRGDHDDRCERALALENPDACYCSHRAALAAYGMSGKAVTLPCGCSAGPWTHALGACPLHPGRVA